MKKLKPKQTPRSRITMSVAVIATVVMLMTGIIPAQSAAITGEISREQGNGLTISMKSANLTDIFKQVGSISDYLFNYQDQDVAGIKATVEVVQGTIADILEQALTGTNLQYVVNERHVVIARKQGAQDVAKITIKGTVTDENNSPLMGVTVIEKGTSNARLSGAYGGYEITVAAGSTLVFSFLSYDSEERKVSLPVTLDVKMKPSNIAINEVVVTALGIKRMEKTLGYSLQEVGSQEFEVIKTDNPLNRLNGKVAGLTVNSRAAILEAPQIKLRGENPIYVVNGTYIPEYSGSSISNDDIESITVLKGPQAAALYGTIGADGAILITTKTGAGAKGIGVTVNSSTMFNAGFLNLPEQQTIYGTGDYGLYSYLDGTGAGVYDGLWTWGPKLDQRDPTTASGWWETVQYNSPIDPETGERIPIPWRSHKNNFGKFLEFGFVTDNSVTVTNQLDRGTTRLSINQMHRKGQTPNTTLDKFGANYSINYDITPRLHVNSSLNYSYTYSKNRPWSGYSNEHPYYNILVYMGSNNDIEDLKDYWEPGLEGYEQRNWNHVWFNNPWFVANELSRPYSEPEFIGNISFDYDITNDLNFMVRAATNSKQQHSELKKPYAWVGNDYGEYNVTATRNINVNLDALLTYAKSFGKFDFDAMLGASYNHSDMNQTYGSTVGGLLMPNLYTLGNSAMSPTPLDKTLVRHQRMSSVFGSATFSFANAVYLTITGRNDWSSRLIKENRSFFYPSASLSVLLSEMFSLPREFTLVKLRGSYAKIGRDMTPYQLENYYTLNDYWGTNAAYEPERRLIDMNIVPFYVTSYEVGTDFRMFNNRLRLDFSYYYNLEEGQIANATLASSTGFEQMLTNTNDYVRYGWEVVLGGSPVKTKNLEWRIDLNWALNRKRLYKIYNDEPKYGEYKVGDRMDAIYEYVWLRDPDGNFVVTENNGRPVSDSFKRIVGYSQPDWECGISTSVRFRKWSFAADISGRYGGVIRSDLNARMIQAGTHKITADPARELDWSMSSSYIPDNAVIVTSGELVYDSVGKIISDTRTFAKSSTPMTYKAWIGYMGQLNGPYTMGYNLFPMDFIKLRSASITYDFSSLVGKVKWIKSLEVSAVGNNLLLLSKIPNEDPDANYKNFSYPTERMVGFNLKFTF